ncbi:glycoside hydrolase family 2 protein [Ulvibacterium marinum]|uniref:glycoside hydrolase family 2 protein n=1 Tax=Ulvibacterium marinum TaxID=2419782 RepID=UPI002494591E|nr:glycoside hydrolase family 2 TIM barrel-domain containing protein [Ulvibacterium marinum]
MRFIPYLKIAYPFFICSFFTFTLYSQELPEGYPQTSRQKLEINQGWQFYLETNQGNVLELDVNRAKWERVNIPHTLELVPSDVSGMDTTYQNKFHRNVGWYKKQLPIRATNDERIFLEFEGVHQVTNLWVNGIHVGEHAIGGYTPFHFDISEYVKRDGSPNEILISADNRLNPNIPPDGNQYDYIKFSGLYRDVFLVITDNLYVTFPWEAQNAGVFVTTPSVTPQNATINIRTTVRNESDNTQDCRLVSRIVDADGIVVSRMETRANIPANSDYTFSQIGGITENVKLWSTDRPYLYRVNTTVYKNDKPVDCLENPLGIRKFEFVRGQGFLLNGKPIELIGANRHQAYPFVGDAVPNSLHWKDAWQFKQAGFNAVRLAHYPHDNSFIQACDELGILVYEEPPSWIGIGDERWFTNLEEATRRMVRNHRNHPSILMWGGSLNHRGPVPQLHYACKQEDPTRVTASNGSPWSGPRNSGATDIYTPMDYQNMDLNPNEFVFLCEHGSSADAGRNQFEVSKARASTNHLGVAVWTAHDYQAFKPNRGLHPRRIFSMYREPNPVYYWYQSELLEKPIIHIADERARMEGKVLVFSNCEEVELYKEDKLIARQQPDHDKEKLYVDHPSFTFDYSWEEGKLTAKGIRNGQPVTEYSLTKAGKPYMLKVLIEEDNRPFYANGSDIKMVKAYILDKEGNHVRMDSTKVTFTINGVGTIVGNASIGANPNKAYYGVASALIKATESTGKLTVKASAKGLKSSEASITTIPYENNKVLAEAKPIYELRQAKIDLGGDQERLLQFGWTEWNPSLNPKSEDFPNLKLGINAEGNELEWQNGWGLSSNLAYVGMDGAKTKGELRLTISGLPKGEYTLKTYHHLMEEVSPKLSYKLLIDNGRSQSTISVVPSMGNRMGNSEPTSISHRIRSDESKSISIQIKSDDKDIPVILNGLEISEIKI